MTSRQTSTFVFVRLPGLSRAVVAGRYTLDSGDQPVGRFVYGRSYLERPGALPLDPQNLPLVPREFTTVKNGALFGVLRDAAPDHWGRLIIEKTGGRPESELDYLLTTDDSRVGALCFGPNSTEAPGEPDYTKLTTLDQIESASAAAAAVEAEVAGEGSVPEHLRLLLEAGSSLGGARPKTVVRDEEGQLWLAKFSSRADVWDNAVAEGAYLRLASRCGIQVPESRIVRLGDHRRVLLVKRFDQHPSAGVEARRLFVSAYSLFDLDEQVMDRRRWSYLELAQILAKVSAAPAYDQRELFCRAVFNALTTNLDDHPRNHALIHAAEGWRLAPAYDLTPSRAASLEQRDLAMACGTTPGRERWANRHNLISGAGYFGLSVEEATGIIDGTSKTIAAEWRAAVQAVGGTVQDANNFAHAIEGYPGFEYTR